MASPEELTTNFYLWEKRGRGWDLWESPVDLEPPFEAFFHSCPSPHVIDDGRKPTLLSSFADSLKKAFWKTTEGADSMIAAKPSADLSASPFECDLDVKELAVGLPITQKVTPEYAEELLLNLGSCSWPLSFEVIGGSNAISVQLASREPDAVHVRQQLHAYYPEMLFWEGVNLRNVLQEKEKETAIVDCALDQEFMRPLRTFKAFDPDPLVGVYAVLESLAADDVGVVQLLFQASRKPWAPNIMRSVRDSYGGPFFADAPEMLPLASEKIRRPLFSVVLRVITQSSTQERAWEIARNLVGSLTTLSQPESNVLIPLTNDGYDDKAHLEDVILRQSRRNGMLLSSEELVGMVHIPSPSVRSSKLRGQDRKTRSAPALAVGHALVLGENLHQGARTLVSLSPEQRFRHVHIIGATGTGKSTLLLNMAVQDIEHGEGLAILDPHGDLIDKILQRIPKSRYEDVVLFDPSDAEYPVGFNILHAESEIEQNVVGSDLVAVLRRFSTTWGDQMTRVMGNAISALLETAEGGTLEDLKRFLIEKEFRSELLRSVKDPMVTFFWEKEYPTLKGSPQNAILTRLDAFLRPKIVRNIVSEREGLDLKSIVNGKKVLLVKLAQGLIGEENSYLLGSIIVSKLHQVVMGRQSMQASERKPFYLYIDEFQHFATLSMAAVLSGARKYQLGLILAHQDLRQLWDYDTTLANSVISNPGTRICFRLGDFDAQKLQDGFGHFDSTDLQNLGIGEAVARVERAEFDFNLKTFIPKDIDAGSVRAAEEELINLSRKKYGRPLSHGTPDVFKKPPAQPVVLKPKIEQPPIERKETERPKPPMATQTAVPKQEERSRHRYLQNLMKQMAEQRGFKAVIEEPTPDGSGRVDVGLERNGKKIACEISVTTGDVQELHNIEKCLRAGYNTIIVCSPEKKNLDAIRKMMSDKLSPDDQSKVLLYEPQDLILFLDDQVAQEANREERVKGYRVKVQYQAVSEVEKKQKREAVAHVIVQSLRRMKEKP